MIYFLRRFLLTIVVLVVAIIWKGSLLVDIAAVGGALLLDLYLTSRSPDLPLYRDDLDFAAPMPVMPARDGLRLHAVAALAGAFIVLVP